MIIPFTNRSPQAPAIDPIYIAMAAAQMHTEGRWPSDDKFEPKKPPRDA